METYDPLHGEQRRLIIPQFVTKNARLSRLLDDERVTGIVRSLLGDDYEYAESDGNLFDCESTWHSDMYGAPLHLHHVKLSFYLDTLRAGLRCDPRDPRHELLQRGLRAECAEAHQGARDRSRATFGVDDRELPSVALETDPGDIVVWDFRTIHASFYGGTRRRLFSINFRERPYRRTSTSRKGECACSRNISTRQSIRAARCTPSTNSPSKGNVLEAIAALTRINRSHPDPSNELRLAELRHAAFDLIDRTPGSSFLAAGANDRSALGNCDSGAPSGGAQQRSGCARSFSRTAACACPSSSRQDRGRRVGGRHRAGLLRMGELAATVREANRVAVVRPLPLDEVSKESLRRTWVTNGAGILTVDSPRLLFMLFETFEAVGLHEIVSRLPR